MRRRYHRPRTVPSPPQERGEAWRSLDVMRKLPVLGALLIAVSLVGSASANAPKSTQLDAKTRPNTTGPIELVDSQCSTGTHSSGGSTVATSKTCLYLYGMEQFSELDVRNDYGVAWLQTNLQGVGGWCVSSVKNRISVEGEINVVDQTPADTTGTPSGKKVTPSVTISAGLAPTPASVSQSFKLYPDKMKSDVQAADSDTTTATLSWAGKQSKKLAFATGVAYSWDLLDGPPSRIEYGLSNFELERCEPGPAHNPSTAPGGPQLLSF